MSYRPGAAPHVSRPMRRDGRNTNVRGLTTKCLTPDATVLLRVHADLPLCWWVSDGDDGFGEVELSKAQARKGDHAIGEHGDIFEFTMSEKLATELGFDR